MQSRTVGGVDGGKQVISFNDKSALLAHLRQNLASNRTSGFAGGLAGSSSILSPSSSSYLPMSNASDSSSNQCAQQLAMLAQKSAADFKLEFTGNGGSLSEESGSSNSGLSPKRPSSLLDPKARALPSASLPRKVATVTPNLSRTRDVTPLRKTAAVETLAKTSSEIQSSSASSMLASLCSAPSALSAFSALSASSTVPSSVPQRPELPSELLNFAAKSDVEANLSKQPTDDSDSGSGLFDNLSLASQLEGFASSTSVTAASTAESLKDLLKTPSNEALSTTAGQQWNGEQTAETSGQETSYPWSNYPQWNNAWNGANPLSSQSGWTNNPWPMQPQQQQQSGFSNGSNTGNNASSAATSEASATSSDIYNNGLNMNFSNFGGSSNQWLNYGTSSNSTTANTPTTSHSTNSQAGQYPSPTYFPNSYLNSSNNTSYETYPQSNGQSGYPNLSGNYNPYTSHTGNNFPPNYSQPYPGSFSQ